MWPQGGDQGLRQAKMKIKNGLTLSFICKKGLFLRGLYKNKKTKIKRHRPKKKACNFADQPAGDAVRETPTSFPVVADRIDYSDPCSAALDQLPIFKFEDRPGGHDGLRGTRLLQEHPLRAQYSLLCE